MILVGNWFEIQLILVVCWIELQVRWLSIDLGFLSDLVGNQVEIQMIWLSTLHWKIEALKLKNEAFLRDFLQKWSFEAQKRSFCARLPSKMKLWSSKTKLLCETSFKNGMSTRRLTSEFQYVLAIFKWMLQKYCACHEKVEPRHTKSCNCHAKWSLQSNTSVTWNLQPFHGFSVGAFKHRHHKARNPCPCHAKRIISEPLQIHHACQHFCNPHELLRLPRILQRVEIPAPATRKALSTSKNAPRPSGFNDFDFQIVLARRRGANFGKLNFQKCSEHAAWCLFFVKIALARRRGANFVDVNFQKCSGPASFSRFWLPNRSRAQTWCKFSEAQLPKVLRTHGVLTILTSKSLSRADVVQIFRSSTSKSAPNPRCFSDFDFQIALARRRGVNFVDILNSRSFAPPRFSDLPFRTFEATKLRKNTAFRAIPTRQNLSCLTSAL